MKNIIHFCCANWLAVTNWCSYSTTKWNSL